MPPEGVLEAANVTFVMNNFLVGASLVVQGLRLCAHNASGQVVH